MHSIFPEKKSKNPYLLLLALLLLATILARFAPRSEAPRRVALAETIAPVYRGNSDKRPGAIIRDVLTEAEKRAPQPINFSLKLRNLQELQERVQRGEIISRAEMRARFLPNQAAWDRIAGWAKTQGLNVKPLDDTHMTVFCQGTPEQIERALNTRFARVRGTDGKEYSSAVEIPSVPMELAADLQGILQLQPHLRPVSSQTARQDPSPGTMLMPTDVLKLYKATNLGLTGAGQTIVVLGVYQVDQADIGAFWGACGLTADTSRFTQLPGGVTGGDQLEETMDIEWAGAIAPGAKIVYLPSIDPEVVSNWVLAQPDSSNIHQLTTSWGIPEFQPVNVTSNYYLTIAAVGGTVFNASGDFGSSTSFRFGIPFRYDSTVAPAASYPASDPYVMAVGGTAVQYATSNGLNVAMQEGAWTFPTNQGSEQWDAQTASTGGYSSRLSRPVWQSQLGLAGNGKRAVPDVAAVAFSNLGQFIYIAGHNYGGGGTSLSAPIWSGLCALINEARANVSLPPVGLLAPKLYPLAGTAAFNLISTGTHAITDGFSATASNGAYAVGGSYNLVTGLGSPDMSQLVPALTMSGQGPVITQAPTDANAIQGDAVSFSVSASGDPTLQYQWMIDGAAVDDGPLIPVNYPASISLPWYAGNISGAHTRTLTITNVYSPDPVAVRVVVTNSRGTAQSENVHLTTTQTFNWFTPTAMDYGAPLSATQLNAVSYVPGTFSYTPSAGTILEPGPHEIVVTFTPSDLNAYRVATLARTITVNRSKPAIDWPQAAAVNYGHPLGSDVLNATCAVAGAFTYDPTNGTVLGTGRHTLTAQFTPTDSTRYLPTTASQILTVLSPGSDGWTSGYQMGNGLGGGAGSRLGFSVGSGSSLDRTGWTLATPFPAAEPWSVQTEAHLAAGSLGTGQFAELSLFVIRTADQALPLEQSHRLQLRLRAGPEVATGQTNLGLSVWRAGAGAKAHDFPTAPNLTTSATLRVSYNADLREFVASATPDGISWTRLGAIRVDEGDFDWGLNGGDTFSVVLVASSGNTGSGNGPASSPSATYFDNLQVPRWSPSVQLISAFKDAPAQFYAPYGVAATAQGITYVSDRWNRSIRRISAEGQVTTLAGGDPNVAGSMDGTGIKAHFQALAEIGLDPSGNIYVADPFNCQIRRISPAGAVTTVAGNQNGGFADGTGWYGTFRSPQGIAVNSSGLIYVADSGNNAIRQCTADGQVTTVAGDGISGYIDGTGSGARFNAPQSIAVDVSGNLFVADTNNHRVRKVTALGVVTTVAGSGVAGYADGSSAASKFNYPAGIAVDVGGNVYVSDTGNRRIRRISSSGEVTTVAGSGAAGAGNAQGSAASFGEPRALSFDASGNLLVADASNNLIRRIAADGTVSTVAGVATPGNTDGPATPAAARILGPVALAFTPSGELLVANSQDGSLSRLSPSGHSLGRYANGLTGPVSLAPEPNGTLLVADRSGNAIKRVDLSSGVATIVAGTGQPGAVNGAGAQASFGAPEGIALSPTGDLFVADTSNQLVRKIAGDGTVTTFVGSGNSSLTDGTGTGASFNLPRSLVFDGQGNLLVADRGNNAIRRIDSLGAVTTFVGSGSPGSVDGSAGVARLNQPSAITRDLSGKFYLAEVGNLKLRTVTPSGIVSTLLPLNFVPSAVSFDPWGSLYVAHAEANEVLRVGHRTATGITWLPPAIVTRGVSFAGQLESASADVPGILTYSYPSNGTGLAQATVNFVPYNSEEYAPATAIVDFAIIKGTQTINLSLPATLPVSADHIPLTATATSGQPVAFSVLSGPAGISNSNLYFSGLGTVRVRASVSGTDDYDPAQLDAEIVITSGLTAQTISFSALPDIPYSTTPVTLSATASSGLTVTFGVVSGPATLNTNTLTLTGTGVVTVRASQPGNASVAPAPDVDRTFTVSANYASWQQGKFTAGELGNASFSGPTADPDADGISNLLEFALALEPKTADRTGLPSIGTVAVSGQKYLTFTYTHQKPATAPDLTYTLVASTDLAGWSPITPVALATVDQGASESLTVRDTVAIGATRGRFLRLSISAPSTTATTPAIGAVTLPTLANSDTLVSVPLACPSVYRDKLSAVNGTVLTVTGTPGWTANQFVKNLPTQANTYYVQLKTGNAAGHFYTVTANAASTLTVDWNGETPSVAAGDQFELIPYWSLGTLYPPADAGVSFTSSINAAVRSSELIFPDLTYVGINPPTAATYYFASGAWRKVGAAAATSFSDLVLTPDSYFVQRNKAAASQLTALGTVVTGPLATLLNAQGGTAKQDNPIALRFAGTVTLAQSNLVGSGVFQSSVNAALRKDELLVFDNTTSGINKSVAATYYYSGGAWRKVGASASADFGTDAVFAPGTGVILRKAGTGAGNPAQDSFWIFIVNP